MQGSSLASMDMEGSQWVLQVKEWPLAKNIDFTHRFHDEREGAAQEAPAHGLGDGRISLREANSS